MFEKIKQLMTGNLSKGGRQVYIDDLRVIATVFVIGVHTVSLAATMTEYGSIPFRVLTIPSPANTARTPKAHTIRRTIIPTTDKMVRFLLSFMAVSPVPPGNTRPVSIGRGFGRYRSSGSKNRCRPG